MEYGSLGTNLDVAQIVIWAFWLFFAGLIFYLRREDRREGYPLESEVTGKLLDPGVVWVPDPKTFRLPHGGTQTAPRDEHDTREVRAKPVASWTGAPLQPTGNPMVDGVGPAAYAMRKDEPELTWDGEPRIVPMRVAKEFTIEEDDPDPRGMDVIAADHKKAGTVNEVWVDRSEPQIRFLEVDVAEGATGGAARRVLLPIAFSRIDGTQRRVNVASILAQQFADVPTLAKPDVVTTLEEDRISAYYAGGHLYAVPSRAEPWM